MKIDIRKVGVEVCFAGNKKHISIEAGFVVIVLLLIFYNKYLCATGIITFRYIVC